MGARWVEQRQLTPETGRAVFEWAPGKSYWPRAGESSPGMQVFTRRGVVLARWGDWIVRGADGSFDVRPDYEPFVEAP